MNKWITGLFATALISGVALADAGAPAVSSKDLSKAVEKVNYVETDVPGVKLNGYVDVGYIYNFTGKTATINNRWSNDATKQGDFNVNAVKLTLEKPLNNKNELQAGFRVDAILGEDGNLLGSAHKEGDSNLFLEQAYVVIRAPYGNGIDFKAGKFASYLGYEAVERPANLNITYSHLHQNIPWVLTGVSAETKFSDLVDGGISISNGANADSNTGYDTNNDGYAIEAKVNLKNKGGNANIQNAVYYSWDSSGQVVSGSENGNVVIYDVWGNWAPKFANDKLLLGFNVDLGYGEEKTVPNTYSSTWWGAALYAKYQFNSIYSLAGRADYIHTDDSGGKFGASYPSNGWSTPGVYNREDLYSITLTNSFDIVENLLLRAEYRADFGDDTTTGNDNSTSTVAHTLAVEAVYTF